MISRSVLAVFCVAVCVLAQLTPAEACSCGGGAPLSLHYMALSFGESRRATEPQRSKQS
jgi:hypothetical protein